MAIMWDAYVSPASLTAFVRAVPIDQAFVLNQILPDRIDPVLEAEFADVTFSTRAAKARAWDTPPLPGRRDAFTTRKAKLPAVSQFMGRGERDRLELERLRMGGQSTSAIEQAIYDDAQINAQSVLARVEIMRGDLLADGKIELPELGPGMIADFQVPAEHIVTAAVLWTDLEDSDIFGDLRAWAEVYRATNGFDPAGMVMSRTVLSAMQQNGTLRALIAGGGSVPPILSLEQLNLILSAYQLPTVRLVYDAQVLDDADQPQRILPADKVILLPPPGVEIGFTQWGMTATGLELQNAGVQVLPGPAGMVAVVDKDVRPPYRETSYVDATVMPILSRPRSLFVADVA